MKKFIAIFLVTSIIFLSCEKEAIDINNPTKDIPNFVGNWTRTYPILGNDFVATYKIDTTKIVYTNEGDGPGNASYTINFDSYKEIDNRWIGHTEDNKYYLIFFKDISEVSISIYKQKVSDPNKAQTIDIPADDNKENYGWNTYHSL